MRRQIAHQAGRHPYAEDTQNNDRKLILDTPKSRRPAFSIFAAAIDCNLVRRQTGAAASAALDIIDNPRPVSGSYPLARTSALPLVGSRSGSGFLRRCVRDPRVMQVNPGSRRTADTFAAKLPLAYTVNKMAWRKRAGLFPAYVHSPQRLIAGIIKYSCGVSNHALGRKVGVDSEALSHRPMAARVLPAIGHESILRRCALSARTRVGTNPTVTDTATSFSLPGSGHTSCLSTVSKAAFHTAAGLPLWVAV